MQVAVIDHPRFNTPEHYNDVANAPLAASLNTGYALAVIEAEGHQARYHDFLSKNLDLNMMVSEVLNGAPDIILIHWVYYWDDGSGVGAFLERLRASGFQGRLGTLGQFPTFCAQELMCRYPVLDMILVGEFEETLAEVLRSIDRKGSLEDIKGLYLKGGFSGRRKLLDPDQLPVPKDVGRNGSLKTLNIAGSRGCYGNCSFCCVHPFYGCSKWRPAGITHIKEELEQRLQRGEKEALYFVDPNFFGPGVKGQKRALELGRHLKDLQLDFGCEARVNDIEEETIASLKEAGLQSVFLGIESASQPVLERMQKNITPAQSVKAVKILQKHAVNIYSGFIMFDPESSLEELQINFDFLEENSLMQTPENTANVLYHNQILLRGTKAFQQLAETKRLIISPDNPFVGKAIFRDKKVEIIKDGMSYLTGSFFKELNQLYCKRRSCFDINRDYFGTEKDRQQLEQLNRGLKDCFQGLIKMVEKAKEALVADFIEEQIQKQRAVIRSMEEGERC